MEARGLAGRADGAAPPAPAWTSPLLSAAVRGLPSRSARPPSGPSAGCLLWLPAGGLPAQGELPIQTPPPPTPTNPDTAVPPAPCPPPRGPHTLFHSPEPCPFSCPPSMDPAFFRAVLPACPSPQLGSGPRLCLVPALLTDPSTPLSQSTNPELPPRLGPVPSGLPQKGTQVRGVPRQVPEELEYLLKESRVD